MSKRLMMMGGSLATFKLIRLYRSDKGIWRYEIERSGNLYHASLHTRDEAKARAVYDRMYRTLSEWRKDDREFGLRP